MHIGAGITKLQQMTKWGIFLETQCSPVNLNGQSRSFKLSKSPIL